MITYPSPSRVIAVSASTFRTNPTVVRILQSIPNKQHSSERLRPARLTTTRYLVRVACALSNLTAYNKIR